VKRLFDWLLIALVLGAVGLGAYAIGTRVDNESNKLAKSDSELNGTTTSATQTTTTSKTNRTPIIVGVALGGAVVVLLLGSAVGAIGRSRKRERWHA
jgi:hypothetical protein